MVGKSLFMLLQIKKQKKCLSETNSPPAVDSHGPSQKGAPMNSEFSDASLADKLLGEQQH